MKKALLGVIIILCLLIVSCAPQVIQPAQQNVVCNKPYILVGTSCCLDKNGDSICDNDERITDMEYGNTSVNNSINQSFFDNDSQSQLNNMTIIQDIPENISTRDQDLKDINERVDNFILSYGTPTIFNSNSLFIIGPPTAYMFWDTGCDLDDIYHYFIFDENKSKGSFVWNIVFYAISTNTQFKVPYTIQKESVLIRQDGAPQISFSYETYDNKAGSAYTTAIKKNGTWFLMPFSVFNLSNEYLCKLDYYEDRNDCYFINAYYSNDKNFCTLIKNNDSLKNSCLDLNPDGYYNFSYNYNYANCEVSKVPDLFERRLCADLLYGVIPELWNTGQFGLIYDYYLDDEFKQSIDRDTFIKKMDSFGNFFYIDDILNKYAWLNHLSKTDNDRWFNALQKEAIVMLIDFKGDKALVKEVVLFYDKGTQRWKFKGKSLFGDNLNRLCVSEEKKDIEYEKVELNGKKRCFELT